MKKTTPDTTNIDATPEVLGDDQVENQTDVQPQVGPVETAPMEPDASAFEVRIIELTNDLQRTRADFENYRKQTELQRSQAMSAARFATVEKFLPLIDDFSRAPAEIGRAHV